MSEPAKAADLAENVSEPKPDIMTAEGLRAFYIVHDIDPDEIERMNALYRAPGPMPPPGGTGVNDLHEDEIADLERIGWRGRNANPKE